MKLLLLICTVLTAVSLNAQIVNIPDANFKAHLVGLPAINTNGDTEIQVSEANAFTGYIDCVNQNISDLTGIEAFTGLIWLNCNNNQLTSLDVSGAIALTYLSCQSNQLTSLDVSNNAALTTLYCDDNQLTWLDVSNNTVLTILTCQFSQLTSLDVSNNTALTDLDVLGNQLTSLDVSNNTALTYLNCSGNQLTSLDVSSNSALTDLICNFNWTLTSLDASGATALTNLTCDNNNQLTSLDVSGAIALTYLSCQSNQLTSLDVSNSTALGYLDCHNNQLQCLNANNGQTIGYLICYYNQLSCVSVYDEVYANQNYSADGNVQFNFSCLPPLNNNVNQLANQLTAAENGVSYQWLDCENNYAIISGETNQTYTPTTSGYYAVELTLTNTCGDIQVDTSTCVIVDCQSDIDNDINQIGTQLSAQQNGVSYQWLDCENNYAIISGETNQTYTPTTTGYYAVELTLTDACGGIQVDTSSCHLVDYTNLDELTQGTVELLKITDLMGRETQFRPNTPLIYYYSDGTIERVLEIE